MTGSFGTSLGEGCVDFTNYKDHYVHIKYTGTDKFSVAVQQHNIECDEALLPFPLTSDTVQASRYATKTGDMYIPLSHFRVDLSKVTGLALENWYSNESSQISKVELIPSRNVPTSIKSVKELDTGTMYSACKDPNHIAFGIDDGDPTLIQQTMDIIKQEQIPVTFFVQGAALNLAGADGDFTSAYQDMYRRGHQIGLHTMSHPKMESLKTEQEIDDQMTNNIDIVKSKLGLETKYFRPPYGTVGSRTRQALGRHVNDSKVIMWSIDVKDWVWGEALGGDPGKMQYQAFKDSLEKGGSIVVMHYLYQSTVSQLPDMIKLAKKKGKQFVRADQCVGDPEAPETWGYQKKGSKGRSGVEIGIGRNGLKVDLIT